MSAEAGWNKLAHARKTLRETYDLTESDWRDQVRREFREHHLDPLEVQVEATLRAMREIGAVLRTVRRECAAHRDDAS